MEAGLIVSLICNVVIAIAGVIGNIIIARISKHQNLEEQSRFNRYISKAAVKYKNAAWIIRTVEGQDFEYFCKKSQKYLIRRYEKIKAEAKTEEESEECF